MWRGRSALRWLDCEMLSDARVLHVERRSAERAFRQQGRESLGGREGGREGADDRHHHNHNRAVAALHGFFLHLPQSVRLAIFFRGRLRVYDD